MNDPAASERATDRAMGALLGVALGDAMGMPSQTLDRERIVATYGTISDLLDASADHPVSGGLRAGTVTDDTEQSLLLARQLLSGEGPFDEERWARSLLAWEKDTHARGVNDLLGPSTKRAIDLLLRGVPASETGRRGTTNGAAMRIVPVGISVPLEPLGPFVNAVAETCRVTHNTSEAIGAAAAVAAIVSAGIGGAGFEAALPMALAAARAGEQLGTAPIAGRISERIAVALALCGTAEDPAAIAREIGTSVAAIASVPMAFAIARLAAGDAWKAATMSANIGDDTDTIGAISCGMVGACSGAASLPPDKVARIVAVNRLDLGPVARGLLALRFGRARGEAQREVLR
jgi:ADP-ribosylglycohydrolase